MSDLEKTKRFNIEDINVTADKKQKPKNNVKSAKKIHKYQASKDLAGKKLKLKQQPDFIDEAEEEVDYELASIVKNNFQEETIINMHLPTGKTIGIASDHRGYKLKQKLTKYLLKKGYTVVNFGTNSKESVDYPDFGFKLGVAVADFEVEKGIAICGSGIGISIACNKIKGVRCAKVDNVKEVKYARKDNDANVIAIAGDMPAFRAKDIIDAYLKTPFTGLDRHKKRIEMLNKRG